MVNDDFLDQLVQCIIEGVKDKIDKDSVLHTRFESIMEMANKHEIQLQAATNTGQ